MRKLFTLTVVLFLLVSVPVLAFVSDFEGEGDTVVCSANWTGTIFSHVDGWYGRVEISDERALEVFSTEGVVYEGSKALGAVLFDTAATDPGAVQWDIRNDESAKLTDMTTGDSLYFYFWVPPEGTVDSQLVVQPYYQHSSWSGWESTTSTIAELYNEGLAGQWKTFALEIVVTSDLMQAMGIQFEYPALCNPSDTMYVDLISSTAGSGVPISADANVLTLPATSVNNLKYEISAAVPVHIDVYNISGQRVKEIVPGVQAAGAYSVNVDLAPGVYLYKVVAEKQSKSTKLIVLE